MQVIDTLMAHGPTRYVNFNFPTQILCALTNLIHTLQNEAEVGEALRSSSIPRSDIWLTSKLWNTFHNPEDVERILDESLQKLGVDYLDLYLIHW